MDMTMKLEVVPVPVTDVDRAKAFYEQVGFKTDIDQTVHEGLRFVHLTPPGSACSIAIGEGIVGTPPGSIQGVLFGHRRRRRSPCRAGRAWDRGEQG